MTYRILTIIARLVANAVSDSEDEGVEGKYAVEVNANLPDNKAASVALDIFHSNIGVGVLDDFEFIVLDGDRVLEQDPDQDDYSGCGLGGDVWNI